MTGRRAPLRSRPRRRAGRLSLAIAIAVMTGLGLSGCPRGGNATNAGLNWVKNAGNYRKPLETFHAAKDPTRIERKAKLTELLDNAPSRSQLDNMSDETRAQVQALLQQLRAQADFNAQLDALFVTSVQRQTTGEQAVKWIVDRSILFDRLGELKTRFVEVSTDILRETVCEVAWDLMVARERTTVSDLLANGQTELSFGDRIEGMATDTREEFVAAIQSAGKSELAKLGFGDWIVDWATYADDLVGKAEEITADGNKTLTAPDGVSATYASVHFVRVCLRPPGS
jgi:hypothetical protein